MRRRNSRVVMSLPVELTIAGRPLRAISQDESPWGMFVRLNPPLAVGTQVELSIAGSDGQRLTTAATVVHMIGDIAAKALGRQPGIGLVFREPDRAPESYHSFVAGVLRLLEGHSQTPRAAGLRIVVADGSTRLLERMSTALGNAGFSVATVTNGMEALAACLSKTPDVVLAGREMPVVDGMQLLAELGQHEDLAAIPVIIMSDENSDLVRLQAFQLGAMDFVSKPFTALEMILRARRLVRMRREGGGIVIMRGQLTADLGLPALLQMLEHEKKTGVLRVTRNELAAWITVEDGRVTRVRSSEMEGESREVLMNVLDWNDGFFELSAGKPDEQSDLDESVTQLLLEHARLRDEARR
jgi:DNA-binding response OmpR family regulator